MKTEQVKTREYYWATMNKKWITFICVECSSFSRHFFSVSLFSENRLVDRFNFYQTKIFNLHGMTWHTYKLQNSKEQNYTGKRRHCVTLLSLSLCVWELKKSAAKRLTGTVCCESKSRAKSPKKGKSIICRGIATAVAANYGHKMQTAKCLSSNEIQLQITLFVYKIPSQYTVSFFIRIKTLKMLSELVTYERNVSRLDYLFSLW